MTITETWGSAVADALTTRHLHVREFPTKLEMSEGQLFGRLVPFNMVAKVVDRLPDGTADIYDEGFRAGVFDRQVKSNEPGVIRRVELVHTHSRGDFLGPAIALSEQDDGLYGEFRVLRSRRSDVEDLIAVGIQQLSVEFLERAKGTVVEDDVRWRTDGHLVRTALEAQGAYRDGATVLAYRDLDELAAEKAERDAAKQAEHERAEADAAAAAAEAAAVAEREERAVEKARRLRELDEWTAEQERTQAELAARFK